MMKFDNLYFILKKRQHFVIVKKRIFTIYIKKGNVIATLEFTQRTRGTRLTFQSYCLLVPSSGLKIITQVYILRAKTTLESSLFVRELARFQHWRVKVLL